MKSKTYHTGKKIATDVLKKYKKFNEKEGTPVKPGNFILEHCLAFRAWANTRFAPTALRGVFPTA